MKMIGDVPWSKMNCDTDIGRALKRAYELMNIPHWPLKRGVGHRRRRRRGGGYWPAYLFGNGEVGEKVSRSRACRSSGAAPATAAARTRPTSTT